MIIVGLLAGMGVYPMAEGVIKKICLSPNVSKVYVLTPQGRFRDEIFFKVNPKVRHINNWEGKDSHDFTGMNREILRQTIKADPDHMAANWIWIGDEDALPADDYLEKLDAMRYDYPVLLTGKTLNVNGMRWYDICSFLKNAEPFAVPYDDWKNPRWQKDLYCSGNQHLFNPAGFALCVPYPSKSGEDPHYCWAFRRAGGHLEFRPELVVYLQKLHTECNYGTPPELLPDL